MKEKSKPVRTLRQPPPELAKTPLQRWVSIKGLSAREFTDLIDKEVHYKYISYVISGSKIPSVKLARLISDATGGEVSINEILRI